MEEYASGRQDWPHPRRGDDCVLRPRLGLQARVVARRTRTGLLSNHVSTMQRQVRELQLRLAKQQTPERLRVGQESNGSSAVHRAIVRLDELGYEGDREARTAAPGESGPPTVLPPTRRARLSRSRTGDREEGAHLSQHTCPPPPPETLSPSQSSRPRRSKSKADDASVRRLLADARRCPEAT